MSFKIPADMALPTDSGSESGSDNDDRCSDWASSIGEAWQTRSLFDQTIYPNSERAIAGDKAKHNFDLEATVARLQLDIYGRMRLINWIRKEKLTPEQVSAIASNDPKLKDDAFLAPVIADDPLLQLAVDDDWSDDEAPVPGPSTTKPEQPSLSVNEELERLRAEVTTLRGIVARTLDEPESKGKGKARDDDTHYFESYTHNDIHEIMLKDTTRTVSYARFILSNPAAFKDKIVMDVGAGTGILSMLAARAGAKHVYAIEASNLASKTRENIAANNLSSVITVLQSKVEDVTLPVDKVDVIISEWMGYMLLYESMLDSVLHARDRYLAPNGLMAPSQTRLVISAITGQRIWRDRVAFWSDVYGFDMPAMTPGYYTEAMIEIVDREEEVTSECIVRDINSHDATPQSLDFHSNFSITSTANEKTTVRAFLTWFDTFFSPIPGKEGHVSSSQDVHIHEFADDLYTRPVEPVNAGDVNAVSFTTGPRGQPTHWKQVAFLLRKPIELGVGERIEGRFMCRKGSDNSRELEVEIHYAVVKKGEKATEFTVQPYRVA